MTPIDPVRLARVCGGESFRQVLPAIKALGDVPLDQTYQATLDLIHDHRFFHEGLMNARIGGGKHFRNVPFVGPYRIMTGVLHHDSIAVAKGKAVTRATWHAP